MGLLVEMHVVGEGEGVLFRGVYRYVCTLEQRCGVEGWLVDTAHWVCLEGLSFCFFKQRLAPHVFTASSHTLSSGTASHQGGSDNQVMGVWRGRIGLE